MCLLFFFFKQKTAYEMRISDWSSDVCSSDLAVGEAGRHPHPGLPVRRGDRAVAFPALRIGRAAGVDDAQPARRSLRAGEAEVEPLEIGRASCRERVCQSV